VMRNLHDNNEICLTLQQDLPVSGENTDLQNEKLELVYLGLDTSCYTTSVCFIRQDGTLASEARKILSVKEGRCGLQQSEMVFQHTRNLPELIKLAIQNHNFKILGIAASCVPRPTENSYMPAFLVGRGLARSLSFLYKVPLAEISHQENHLEAGVWSAGGPRTKRFLMLHASGGTTDLLLAELKIPNGRYTLTQLGGSMDLHAGQFIDRLGVALGLKFPCGPELEKLACECGDGTEIELPVSAHGLNVSLSGPCSAALRMLAAGVNQAELARAAEKCLAETFFRLLSNGAGMSGVNDVLLVGGVGCNKYIRSYVERRLAKHGIRLWVPAVRYSGDNASGCAAFARRNFAVNS